VRTAGGTEEPYWGEVVLGDKERQGDMAEEYLVYVPYKETELSTGVELDVWRELRVDTMHRFKVVAGTWLTFVE
jgi:ABC-type Mn2+/Zn2+ transport system ATPase subunit